MKFFTLVLSLAISGLCQACSENTDSSSETTTSQDSLAVTEPPSSEINSTDQTFPQPTATPSETKEKGNYNEYYPDGALKLSGNRNNSGARDGVWVSYFETGIKWSEMAYQNGEKHGHTITFYPSGKPRYIGEYRSNQKFGHWVFYEETEELSQEIDY